MSNYTVLQSKGVTGGAWCGYNMSGTLTNGSGETINVGNANSYYTGNIDGYDISNYNQKTKDLYNAIKASEYTQSGIYGKGLFLVSNAKCGTTTSEKQGSGNYWAAIKASAINHDSFESIGSNSWLGTVINDWAWNIEDSGLVSTTGWNDQKFSCVVAPAFNLNTRLVKLDGNVISLS